MKKLIVLMVAVFISSCGSDGSNGSSNNAPVQVA